jgi:hypothetical protein
MKNKNPFYIIIEYNILHKSYDKTKQMFFTLKIYQL